MNTEPCFLASIYIFIYIWYSEILKGQSAVFRKVKICVLQFLGKHLNV